MTVRQLKERVEERLRDWNVAAQSTLETESSFIVYGARGSQPVVLKVIRRAGDEWRCGEVLNALESDATVRVYEYVEGAVLLERLTPGTSLADVALAGRDEQAAGIIAEVIERMSHSTGSWKGFATVEDWGRGFHRYKSSGDDQIPIDLVEQAQSLYAQLCASQREIRLLHGDLQHYNILFDSKRGWVAIDPKGVAGEVEYEVGASLRNPYEKPYMFASPQAVERRLKIYESRLKLDLNRALEWGFAQAVLSAIWTVEDGSEVDDRNSGIILANAIRHMLK